MLALLTLLLPAAFAVDADGDGVASTSDCDDTDAGVYRNERSLKDYTLASDAEVDAFCDTYCARNFDELTLDGVSTTDGLSCVASLGRLMVEAPELDSLSGLSGLEYAKVLSVHSSALTDLEGLSSLTTLTTLVIGCDASATSSLVSTVNRTWDDDEDLVEFDWIDDDLASCTDDANPFLVDLSGLDGLYEVENVLIGAGTLTDLHGLEFVTQLENLGIYGQTALTDLRGLDNLEEINDELYIGDSDAMSSLRGLGALTSVSGVSLEANDTLTDLSGLGALSYSAYIRLIDNRRMRSLRGLDAIADGFGLYIEGISLISDMDGLEGVKKLDRLDLLNMPMLTSLAGLEDLTSITRTLQIMGAPRLSSMEGLSSLTKVGDRLSLGCYRSMVGGVVCSPLPELSSLSGLDALTSAGRLTLVGLPSLTSLSPLHGVGPLTGLEVEGTGLVDLSGMSALSTVAELNVGCHRSYDDQISDSSYYRWTCSGNDALESLDGLTALTRAYKVQIVGNRALTDVSGLSSGQITALHVANNASLESLEGLGTMSSLSVLALGCWKTSEDADFWAAACPGEPALTTAPTVSASAPVPTLQIADTPKLTDLAPLGAVTSWSDVFVSGAVDADLFAELDLSKKVWYSLGIGCQPRYVTDDGVYDVHCPGTTGLTSLEGLGGLTSASYLWIVNNKDLSDVSALSGLSSVTDVTISYNRSLSTSDATALVSAIDRISGTTTVSGNKP